MWELKIHPALTFNNAARVDRIDYARSGFLPPSLGLNKSFWDRSFTELSFNSGLVWAVTPADQLRLTAAVERRVLVTVSVDF